MLWQFKASQSVQQVRHTPSYPGDELTGHAVLAHTESCCSVASSRTMGDKHLDETLGEEDLDGLFYNRQQA